MRKVLFTLMIIAFLACPAMAQRYRQMQLFIVDELADAVTDITSITIYDAGTTSATTIYADRAGKISMTNPITTTSTASSFVQALGLVSWFQAAPDYKVTITDGTKTLTIDEQNASRTRFPWFENYIGTAASLSVADNQEIVLGTDSDVVAQWENANDIISWIPDADGVSFDIGDTDVAKQFNFNVYVGGIGGGGLTIDEGVPSFAWTGGAASINASSNYATNINTGTSTGAITLGSATSGAWAIDGTAGGTINADDSIDITTSGAAADIDIDAAAGSVIIDAGEAAADGITLLSAGGIDITAVDDVDFTLTSGATDENLSITLTGATASSIILASSGTGADAFDIDVTAGGIDIDMAGGAAGEDFSITTATSITLTTSEAAADQFKVDATGTIDGDAINFETSNGGIMLNADGGTNGDIELDAADDMTLTAAGDLTLAVTGTLAGGGATMDNFYSTTEVVTGTTDTLTAAQSGNMIIYTMTSAACTVTLPEATSGTVGMWFFLIDGSVTAGRDLSIDPEGGGQINGAAAGNTIKCENDRDGEGILIFSTAADTWYTIAFGSSTVWTEE